MSELLLRASQLAQNRPPRLPRDVTDFLGRESFNAVQIQHLTLFVGKGGQNGLQIQAVVDLARLGATPVDGILLVESRERNERSPPAAIMKQIADRHEEIPLFHHTPLPANYLETSLLQQILSIMSMMCQGVRVPEPGIEEIEDIRPPPDADRLLPVSLFALWSHRHPSHWKRQLTLTVAYQDKRPRARIDCTNFPLHWDPGEIVSVALGDPSSSTESRNQILRVIVFMDSLEHHCRSSGAVHNSTLRRRRRNTMTIRMMTLFLSGSICVITQPAAADGDARECPIQTAMKKLPQLEYQVGTKKTRCAETAAKLAKEQDTSVRFCIGTECFDSQAAATAKLSEQTEVLVARLTTPTKCEVSGTITVGDKTCDCPEKAATMAKRVKQAMDAVTVSYKVGNQECDCPVKAKDLSAQLDSEVLFCVNGEETACPVEHRLNTARARYKAGIEALVAVEK